MLRIVIKDLLLWYDWVGRVRSIGLTPTSNLLVCCAKAQLFVSFGTLFGRECAIHCCNEQALGLLNGSGLAHSNQAPIVVPHALACQRLTHQLPNPTPCANHCIATSSGRHIGTPGDVGGGGAERRQRSVIGSTRTGPTRGKKLGRGGTRQAVQATGTLPDAGWGGMDM